MTRFACVLSLAIAAACFSTVAEAETIVHYREGQRVDAEDVARLLTPPRTRSIKLLDDAPAAAVATAALAPVVATTSTAAAPASAGLSLPVRFGFGSSEILPTARPQLDALAQGIALLPPATTVTIEGHTDAAGSDAYNRTLSRERARAVRDYLVREHGIDGTRLRTVGFGEDRPVDGSDPFAAINRRVEFRGS